MKKKDVIYCYKTDTYYFDYTSILRTFEKEIITNVTFNEAKKFIANKYQKEVVDVEQIILNARLDS